MPGQDEVLINIKYSGVCHCDLNAMKGDLGKPSKVPFIGGHEGAGVGELCPVLSRAPMSIHHRNADHAQSSAWAPASPLSSSATTPA